MWSWNIFYVSTLCDCSPWKLFLKKNSNQMYLWYIYRNQAFSCWTRVCSGSSKPIEFVQWVAAKARTRARLLVLHWLMGFSSVFCRCLCTAWASVMYRYFYIRKPLSQNHYLPSLQLFVSEYMHLFLYSTLSATNTLTTGGQMKRRYF